MNSGARGDLSFLDQAGEIGELIRRTDWAATPLGPLENWPGYLKITVATILQAGLPMVLLCGEHAILIYNARYAELSGARHPQIMGMAAAEAWPEVADFNADVIRRVLAGEVLAFHERNMVLYRSGEPEQLWLSLDYSPVRDETGRPRLALAIVRDVTERVETAQRLRIAQEAGGVGSFEWFPDTGRLVVSEQYRRIWGLTQDEEVTEAKLVALVHPDDRPLAGVHRRHQSNPIDYAEFRRVDPVTGDIRWLARQGEVLARPDGLPRYLGVVYDITQRKRSEEAFAQSELRWRDLFEQMQEGFAVCEPVRDAQGRIEDFRFVELNPAFEKQTGIALHDAMGRCIRNLAPNIDPAILQRYAEVMATGRPIQFETRASGTDSRWFDIRARAVGDDRLALMFMDITARHLAEQGIRESEASLRTIAQSLPNHVWTACSDGQLDWFNDRAYAYSGVEPGTLDGDRWTSLVHPDDLDDAAVAWSAAIKDGSTYEVEFRMRRHDGSYRWHLVRAVPVRNRDGSIQRWVGTSTDIEDQKAAEAALTQLTATLEDRVARRSAELLRTQDALRQAQKMEAIGNLTGGIAHDFNNLLQVISGNLQLLERDAGDDEISATRIRHAMSGVTRGSKLASQLLAFGRRQPLAPKVVNLGRLVRDMDEMLRRTLGEAIEVETVIGGGLWNTEVDPGNVENALLNLAINARDAMQGQGRLTIEAGNALLDADYVSANGDVIPGQYVMLAVSDTGCGMSPEVIEKVFEPFFTTKPEGRGTGLGLSMVYGFVKQSGGHIKIYSEPGQGTTIKLYLQRCTREEDPLPDPADSGPVVGGNETILVVEDDDAVRATVIAMLKDLGYRVLKARHAASALAIIEGGARIDLLFTDVIMPGPMRSVDMVQEARRYLPRLAVLFTSGYTQNSIVHGGRLDEGVELLSKPYSRQALARRLRQVLAGPGSTVPEREKRAAPKPRAIAQDARPLRILVCEDDWMIRSLVTEMLASRGHDVVEAVDGAEALAAHINQPVEVLLTDVGLPDISGIELARKLRTQAPGLPVIFATGEKHVEGIELDRLTHILTKPFGSDQLRQVLATVYDART